MKKISIALFLLSTSIMWAQSDSASSSDLNTKQKYTSQTLFSSNKGFGAYVGLNSKVSSFNSQTSLLTGAEFNFVIAHKLNLGVEAYGLVNPVKSHNVNNNDSSSTYLNIGYGGIHIEPVFFSSKLVHFSLPLMLGVGGIAETKKSYMDEYYYDNEFEDDDLLHTDFFLVAEPGALLEVNVFKFMRLGAGVSYRFVSGVDLKNQSNNDLQGLSGNLSLRLGWF